MDEIAPSCAACRTSGRCGSRPRARSRWSCWPTDAERARRRRRSTGVGPRRAVRRLGDLPPLALGPALAAAAAPHRPLDDLRLHRAPATRRSGCSCSTGRRACSPSSGSGALAGVAFCLAWIDAPRWLQAALYVALGWVAVIARRRRSLDALRRRARRADRRRRRPLHGRRRRLRAPAPGPVAADLRLPRDLPRVRDRRARVCHFVAICFVVRR